MIIFPSAVAFFERLSCQSTVIGWIFLSELYFKTEMKLLAVSCPCNMNLYSCSIMVRVVAVTGLMKDSQGWVSPFHPPPAGFTPCLGCFVCEHFTYFHTQAFTLSYTSPPSLLDALSSFCVFGFGGVAFLQQALNQRTAHLCIWTWQPEKISVLILLEWRYGNFL